MNEIPSRMSPKNALNAAKPQWLNLLFLVLVCGLLSIALLSFSFSVSSGILTFPVFSILVCLVLFLSSLFSSFIIQTICCRANAFDYASYWLAVIDELLKQTNWSNRYLDWFFRRMRRGKETFCDSEAIRRITESLVSSTIAPWSGHIGNNESFSQVSCLALEQALTNISSLVQLVDMRSLVTDLTLIIHRHLKKQGRRSWTIVVSLHSEHFLEASLKEFRSFLKNKYSYIPYRSPVVTFSFVNLFISPSFMPTATLYSAQVSLPD